MKLAMFFSLSFILLHVNLFADNKDKKFYKSQISGSLLASTYVGGSATDG